MSGFEPVGSLPVAALPTTGATFFPAGGPLVFTGAGPSTNPAFPNGGPLVFHGAAIPAIIVSNPRVSTFALEVSHAGSAAARVSTFALEVSHSLPSTFKPAGGPLAFHGAQPFLNRLFPASGAVVFTGAIPSINIVPPTGQPRVSTFALEVSHVGAAAARVSTLALEVAHAGSASARVSTFALEVSHSIDLDNLSVSVLWDW